MNKIIINILLFMLPLYGYSDNVSKHAHPGNIPEHSHRDEVSGVAKYTGDLVSTVSTTLDNPAMTEQAKLSKIRDLLNQNLDFQRMASFALGPYSYHNKRDDNVKKLSEEQQKAFTKVYTEYVIGIYTKLVKGYKGQKAKVINIQKILPGEFAVLMTINEQNPIRVKYLVRAVGNSFKVNDIITEELSLINTHRAEFMGILANSGFDALMQQLRAKSQ